MGCGSSKSTTVVEKPLPRQKERGKPLLYIWPGSAPCRAVLMTTRAANIDVQKHNLDLFKEEHKSQQFKKINPECTIPTLVDGDNKIWESRPMMQHLVDKYNPGHKIYPEEIEIRTLVDKYLTFDEDEVYPAVSSWVYPQVFAKMTPDSSNREEVERVLSELDTLLSLQPYAATNHVTIADLSLIATVSLLELLDWKFKKWTSVQKWMNRMKGLAYYPECNKGLEDWKLYLHVREMQENEE